MIFDTDLELIFEFGLVVISYFFRSIYIISGPPVAGITSA